MRSFAASWIGFAFCSVVVFGALTGCGGGSTSATSNATAPEPSTPFTAPANTPPTIAGSAVTSVVAGQAYTFKPSANDPDKDLVTFSIANKPAWAAFSATTGALTGTPASKDVGAYARIEIAATDGDKVAALPAFTITVTAPASTAASSVAVAWTPPTQNEDGSSLTDLSGYKIHYGDASKSYTQSIAVSNPGLTRYVIDSLPTGKHYLAMTAYNTAGAESEYSPEVSVTVN